jgi:hypothetical protein
MRVVFQRAWEASTSAHAAHTRSTSASVSEGCNGSIGDAFGMGKAAAMIAEAAIQRGQVGRFVGHSGADAALFQRVAEFAPRQRDLGERQQRREQVPAVAVFVAGIARMRQFAGRFGAEAFEVAADQRAALRVERRQLRQLRDAHRRVDVGEVELAAGDGDVARAVGEEGDAVEAQHLDLAGFALVAHDQRAAFNRRDVLVRMEAEDADVAEAADALAAPG